MRTIVLCLAASLCWQGAVAFAQTQAPAEGKPSSAANEYGPPEYGHGLTEQDALAGWISLFDGKTTYGWNDAQVQDGRLTKGTTTVTVGACELKADVDAPGALVVGGGQVHRVKPGLFTLASTGKPGTIRLDGGGIRRLLLRPLNLQSLLNGNDLAGWKIIPHPKLKDQPAKFKVSDGLLHVVGGPGALEYQEKQYADLVLQVEARTHVRYSNSGLFFRSVPGQFMNGYEAQIHHRCHDGDVAKPWTWATGGIDDRQNARRLVSRDGHFFISTVIARGPHLATWINGYQTADWIDTRAKHDNPRQGLRLEAGTIQLQAHDPGTDVAFRRVAAAKW
jgi:hypothetical protein